VIHRLKAVVAPLFYCLLASTTLRLVVRRVVPAVLLCALIFGLPATNAVAGEFEVATCKADTGNYSVRAFNHFAHRRMMIRYACDPAGPGLRGVVTQNVVRKGRVKRGSIALVTIEAPPETRMTSFTWAGRLHRRDCRYALQMWADAPDVKAIPIKNVLANRRCPRPRRAQAASFAKQTYAIPGATKIVQRVVCVGTKRQNWCSGNEANYINTEEASVVFSDALPPTVEIQQDTPLAQGAWVSGQQPLNYTASDNVGVQRAAALISGVEHAAHDRPCLLASPKGPFTDPVPCPSGPGQMVVRTNEAKTEGTHQLVVEAQDAGGNRTASAPVLARIDSTAPPRVEVTVEAGDAWRNVNEWAAVWTNPDEGDRAPITAANYELCAAGTTSCSRGTAAAPGISRLPLTVPDAGEWTLSVWRRDAAGNEEDEHASVPATLRYDPDPPQLAFEASDPQDPTLVAVRVTDQLSGLADGTIEIAASGSAAWQTLATQKESSRLVTRIDDAALPAGTYVLRARAQDRAGNQTLIDSRSDGQPMVVTLPLRGPAILKAGFERTVRAPGKRRGRIVVLRPAARVGFGKRVTIAGRLATSDGQAIANAHVQLLTATGSEPEQLVETLTTDADGRFRTSGTGVNTRSLRLAFAGSLQALPVQQTLEMRVPAATSSRVSRARVRNGKAVTFSGRVKGLPVPPNGKLVEIQVRFTDRWQTFRTTRSDALGRWSSRYRFQRTRGVQRYRFRVRLPKEAGYPFETSVSRTLAVQVSGT
jgi:hypothetical protein